MKQILLIQLLFVFGLCFLCIQCQNRKATHITFLASPDDSGTLKEIISHFNDSYKGEIKVKLKEGPRSSSEHYNLIQSAFHDGEPDFDVFASDVVWTASVAANGLAEDLSTRFYNNFEPNDFLQASLNSAIYQHHVWGIPWFTDTGLLYYRKDLLKQAGFNQAPKTWQELSSMVSEITKENDIKYGYTFQGAQYEGGVSNACEFIWNSGGDLMIGDLDIQGSFDELEFDPNIITVNSTEAVQGLTDAVNLVKKGIAPPDVYLHLEKEATDNFINGKAVFMRNWPGIYGQISSTNSKVAPEQVGIAAIPVSDTNQTSFSCLGGWNLMINAQSNLEKKEAAWTLINYLVDSRRQKYRAIVGGNLPSLRALYEDEELLSKNPIMNEFKHIIPNARSRPNSPYYKDISPIISELFNQVLRQEITPEMAVFTMESRLQDLMRTERSS